MLLHENDICHLLNGKDFCTAPQTVVTWLRNVEDKTMLSGL